MPNIRILNWNIRTLSAAKLAIPGMRTAIARSIVALNPDIVVLLKVRSLSGAGAVQMQQLANAMNVLAGGAQYTTWQLSQVTGSEYYAFFVRDTAVVRPMACIQNPNGPAQPGFGTTANPLSNLAAGRWSTWPNNGWVAAAAGGQAPNAPLVNTFLTPRRDRAAKRQRTNFAGRSAADGGYALGRGFPHAVHGAVPRTHRAR